ncbi:MAG: site-specific integrase [Ignavibacteria bacterium]|nr:site-specific integrase [Ignavibacteria bacterium]
MRKNFTNQKKNKYGLSNKQKENKSLKKLHELFIKYKLHSVCCAPATIKGYCQAFNLLMQYRPDLTLNELTEETMILFFEFLNTRLRQVGKQKIVRVYKNSSVASVRGKLGTFFKWLVVRRYIGENPFSKMEYPDISYTDSRAFKSYEFDIICNAINTKIHWLNLLIKKRNIAIVMLLAYMGLRKEELIGLTLSDVDMIRKLITIRSVTTKSKRGRILPINNELLPYLFDYLDCRRCYTTKAFWVSGTLDRPFTEHGMKYLSNLLTQVTKINCHWHRYRHMFATNFYYTTKDLLTLHKLMGHSSIKMTLSYLRSLSDEQTISQIKRISIGEFV